MRRAYHQANDFLLHITSLTNSYCGRIESFYMIVEIAVFKFTNIKDLCLYLQLQLLESFRLHENKFHARYFSQDFLLEKNSILSLRPQFFLTSTLKKKKKFHYMLHIAVDIIKTISQGITRIILKQILAESPLTFKRFLNVVEDNFELINYFWDKNQWSISTTG